MAGRFQNVAFAKHSAAHIRFQNLLKSRGLRAASLHNVAIALAPRTSMFKIRKSFTDGGRVVVKMWSPALAPRAFVFNICETFTD
eukprot:4659284-Pyramimonas_sp.AAC.1